MKNIYNDLKNREDRVGKNFAEEALASLLFIACFTLLAILYFELH